MTSKDFSFEVPNSSKIKPKASKTSKRRYQRWWIRLILVFLMIFAILFIAMAFYVGRVAYDLRTGKITPEELFGEGFRSSRDGETETFATEDDPSLGRQDAKVVIVEFSDFQCPFCAEAYPVVKQILKDYGSQVRFVYRDFPLVDIHPQAVLAAMAGECAHEQGQFWQMHDKIFENQRELSEASLKIWAVQLGLNSLQFSGCLDSNKYLSEIEQDLEDGFNAGVRATPTFFINGQRIEGAIPINTFEQIIIAALSR
ncbi:DsbA family protein [Candidatus Falkowbacteria bacterium]|nr:DsbA family protein [Candidatus Falkowbacteria bacterium]